MRGVRDVLQPLDPLVEIIRRPADEMSDGLVPFRRSRMIAGKLKLPLSRYVLVRQYK
jgi:hypothetical protein